MGDYDQARRSMTEELNARRAEREALETEYEEVWDTKQLQENFEVLGFAAPFCIVVRKSDNKRGTLLFQHLPRYYFSFREDA